MNPLPLFEYCQNKEVYEFFKRLFDIFFSLLILFFTLPLFLLIAIAIRLDSPGPVIFSQRRIGLNKRGVETLRNTMPEQRNDKELKGKFITVYKFRTMHVDTDPYHVKPATPKDSRLTSVGKFLRIFCLDELPQFINVLKGDMSIVGPRPEMPFIVDSYSPIEAQRLLVKPGITGLWQIYGTRRQPIHENIHFDFDYIQHRNLFLDLAILMKTTVFIFRVQNV